MFILNNFIIGMSGSMYSGLTDGSHTIDVHFTPAGSSNTTVLQSNFVIGNHVLCSSYIAM